MLLSKDNSTTVENWTYVYMNILGNKILKLRP
jgi:hypothetical protein